MINPLHYQELKTQLQNLQEQVQANLNLEDWGRSHAQIQAFFQTQILSHSSPEISATAESELVSYYVEINKQLKLLGTDLMMLQTARNPATITQRTKQIGDRLKMLISYCDSLLGIGSR